MKRPRLLFGNFGGSQRTDPPGTIGPAPDEERLRDRVRSLLGVMAILLAYAVVYGSGGPLAFLEAFWRLILFACVCLGGLYLLARFALRFPRQILGVIVFLSVLFFLVRFVKWAWQ